ncbi:MAG: AAA family ATPase [Planctomycetota bacterium]|nr:AAA family ATPase [Planctomycetota bacterium]
MRTIAIINQKGGCGKTTTAINLAALLARRGIRTLIVDMDPQSHCAAGLGIPEGRIDLDVGDAMLSSDSRVLDTRRLIWRVSKNLDLLPSRMRLAALEASRGGLADRPDKEKRLASVLARVGVGYDVVCVDCPPTIGLLTYNAISCASMALIPVETGFFSMQGAQRQVMTVKTVARRMELSLPIWLLPTLHDENNAVACDLLQEMRRRSATRVVPVVIRFDEKLREAASFGQAICQYAPNSRGTADYSSLTSWMLHHGLVTKETPGALEPEDAVLNEPAYDAYAALGEREPALLEVNGRSGSGSAPGDVGVSGVGGPGVGGPGVGGGELAAGELSGGELGGEAELKPASRREDLLRLAAMTVRKAVEARVRQEGAPGAAAANSVGGPAQPVGPAEFSRMPRPDAGLNADIAWSNGSGSEGSGSELANSDAAGIDGLIAGGGRLGSGGGATAIAVEQQARAATADVSAEIFFGVRSTRQGALFVQPLTLGSRLCVAGEFNAWSATSLPMKRNEDRGVYELLLPLSPGRYQYRLVADGRWIADPHNSCLQSNSVGQDNSVVEVQAYGT